MKRRKVRWLLPVTLVLLFAVACGTRYVLLQKGKQTLAANAAVQIADEDSQRVRYKGKTYSYNKNIITILCMGIDREGFNDDGRVAAGQSGQADSLFLAVLDTRTGEIKLIAISRDTMTDINVYSDQGNFVGTEKLQLCLAYTYGDGREKSCENTKKAVSCLFYGIPVHAYMALDLTAIADLNDVVGGVEVPVTKDLAILDPSLKEGEKIKLHGEQAQRYVRSRLTEEAQASADANNDRIERQKQYLMAFGAKALASTKKDIRLPFTLYKTVEKSMITDLSVSECVYLGTMAAKSGMKTVEIQSVPGKSVMGEKYAEFQVDDKKLYEKILDIFYVECDEK